MDPYRLHLHWPRRSAPVWRGLHLHMLVMIIIIMRKGTPTSSLCHPLRVSYALPACTSPSRAVGAVRAWRALRLRPLPSLAPLVALCAVLVQCLWWLLGMAQAIIAQYVSLALLAPHLAWFRMMPIIIVMVLLIIFLGPPALLALQVHFLLWKGKPYATHVQQASISQTQVPLLASHAKPISLARSKVRTVFASQGLHQTYLVCAAFRAHRALFSLRLEAAHAMHAPSFPQ